MDLEQVKSESARLSPWAHLATIGNDGRPDVAPVHPAWDGDTIWIMTGATSTKARNIGAHTDVAMHWQVDESGDGVEVWGAATVHADVETKRRLWTGVFDYNLDDFAPGGPDGSPDIAMVAVAPYRAVCIKAYGMGGIERWSSG